MNEQAEDVGHSQTRLSACAAAAATVKTGT